MTSDSDDLEQQLRQNLKLRAELGAQVAKAKQGGGMASRLGWILYWICLALAGVWVVFFCNVTFWGGEKWGSALDTVMAFGIPILVLYGIGRAIRYVLSAE